LNFYIFELLGGGAMVAQASACGWSFYILSCFGSRGWWHRLQSVEGDEVAREGLKPRKTLHFLLRLSRSAFLNHRIHNGELQLPLQRIDPI
jgi:hypothetical protein